MISYISFTSILRFHSSIIGEKLRYTHTHQVWEFNLDFVIVNTVLLLLFRVPRTELGQIPCHRKGGRVYFLLSSDKVSVQTTLRKRLLSFSFTDEGNWRDYLSEATKNVSSSSVWPPKHPFQSSFLSTEACTLSSPRPTRNPKFRVA